MLSAINPQLIAEREKSRARRGRGSRHFRTQLLPTAPSISLLNQGCDAMVGRGRWSAAVRAYQGRESPRAVRAGHTS